MLSIVTYKLPSNKDKYVTADSWIGTLCHIWHKWSVY